MKIIGFAQLHNEIQKGNLENWFMSMRFCDFIYIYDQNSEDGSREYYKKFPNVKVITSDVNNFKNEILCKSTLLEEVLKDHPDTDWIFWMDGDTIVERSANRASVEGLLMKADQYNLEGLYVGHYNLWRSDIHYRTDNQYHWLHENGVLAFWKNNGNLVFPKNEGLHNKQYPEGMNRVARVNNFNLIHRGFATDDQIANKYITYKERGQSGWALDRLLDESTLAVEELSVDRLPVWFDLKDDTSPLNKKRIKDVKNL